MVQIALRGYRSDLCRKGRATLVSEGFGDELAKAVQKVAQTIGAESHRLLSGRAVPISPASLFVITRAISGILRAASQEQSPLLGTLEFENELVKLVQSYSTCRSGPCDAQERVIPQSRSYEGG
ncbi:MAG TPA: hypothetical protein VKY85_27025 [Candidatus Angelobacter sp.]|nr:hypothetical protein [Candidatus Angelobacter sp.]